MAREAGPGSFDTLVALTGHASERYTWLVGLDGAISADAGERGQGGEEDDDTSFLRDIRRLYSPDGPEIRGGVCPGKARLMEAVARGTPARDIGEMHILARIHRELAWKHQMRRQDMHRGGKRKRPPRGQRGKNKGRQSQEAAG